jgi:hydrogenase nickel incorporation protein HypA/HybF
MHEVSIALSLLDLITAQCKKEGYHSIGSVRLRIGRASGILPDALLFAFDAIKADTFARDAVLVVDNVSLGGICTQCSSEFEVEEAYVLECPKCGSGSFRINKGYELDIVEMEVN